MSWEFSPRLLPELITAAVALYCIRSIWPLQRAPSARTLIGLLFALAAWALTDFAQYGSQILEPKLFWSNLIYVWVGLSVSLYFVFALQYTNVRGRLRASEFLSLLIVPAIGVILAFADPTDGLVRRNVSLEMVRGVTHVSKTYGPVFWAVSVYLHLLMLGGSILLIRLTLRGSRVFGAQGLVLFLAALVPWVASIAYVTTNYRFFTIDPTPIAVGISAFLLVIAVRRMALFDLSPAGRDAAIEAMVDGWMVIDPADRLVDLNPSARRMLERGSIVSSRVPDVMGRRLSILAPSLSPILRAHMPAEDRAAAVTLGHGRTARSYRVEESQIYNRYGAAEGFVLTLHDVTEEIAAHREREELVVALQSALADVRQLSGLLPICAHCKKIRDDQGYWTQLEQFITQHSTATFTHGLCPDCERRLAEQAIDEEIKRANREAQRDAADAAHSPEGQAT